MQGYYCFPTIHADRVVFVADDDLWEISTQGGVARRLSTNLGSVWSPHYSPDGREIAFAGTEEGNWEVYLMPSTGGPPVRPQTSLQRSSAALGSSPASRRQRPESSSGARHSSSPALRA